MKRGFVVGVFVVTVMVMAACAAIAGTSWVHQGFSDFVKGTFDDGGSNLYVNADGVIEIINRWDVNNDGAIDLILADNHDNLERGPTRVYKVDKSSKGPWKYKQLPNDSSYSSKIVDLDADGKNDLIVTNYFNGINSELPCFVYWGESGGLSTKPTELPAIGAMDVAVLDINRDGALDLVFPSAWKDPHNPAEPMNAKVYLQKKGRKFDDASETYRISCVGAVGIAADDLNKDGFTDLVIGNSRSEYDPKTDSFIYWGTKDGVDAASPQKLPTYGVSQVKTVDLNGDGFSELVCRNKQITIYWNRKGAIRATDITEIPGGWLDVVDVDLDGSLDLVTITPVGVEIRSVRNLDLVTTVLPAKGSVRVTAHDLDGDKRPELIVSRMVGENKYDTESPIFWNGPDGYDFNKATWIPTSGAQGNAAGDLDGDGKPEIVFNNTAGGHAGENVMSYIYLGDGKGQYSPTRRYELPSAGSCVSNVVDLDRDGYNDVLFSSMGMYPGGHGRFGGSRIFWGAKDGIRSDRYFDLVSPNNNVFDLRTADYNKDGYLDVLVVGSDQEVVTVGSTGQKEEKELRSSALFWGSASGFSRDKAIYFPNYGYYGATADVNKDGWLDILFDDRRDYIRIYPGSEKGFSLDNLIKIPSEAMGEGASITTADINKDGWPDIVLGMNSARLRKDDTIHIYYGGPTGYDPKNQQVYLGAYSTAYPALADFNNDGNLDMAVSAYLSAKSRVLPAQVFYGNGKTIDFSRPVNLYSEGSTGVIQMDFNRDGWIDAFVLCHRNDIGHQVNSRLYWNSAKGFDEKKVTLLPGLGPHGTYAREFGNAYTRDPWEDYISPAYDTQGQRPTALSWIAEVPPDTALKFQLRSSDTEAELQRAKWQGPTSEDLFYEKPGTAVYGLSGKFIQYRARFVYPTGCGTPRLRQVRVEFGE